MAKKCLDCDELLFPYRNIQRCKSCKKIWDNERSKKNQKRIRTKKGVIAGDNGKCITCGKDISHLSGNSLRCKKCKSDLTIYKQPIVARECIICGDIFAESKGKYCSDECRKTAKNRQQILYNTLPTKYKKCVNKPNKLPTNVVERYREIRKITREYVRNNFRKLARDQRLEALGTYATAQVFRSGKYCGVRKKENGVIDCEKEREEVNFLRKKTFSREDTQYCETEGDFIRNITQKEDYNKGRYRKNV